MKQKFYWTEEKVEELKRIWNTKSLYTIATTFHTTEETIREKAKELGLEEYKSNRWTKEEEELLKEYSKKYVTKTIAKKLGRSYIAVQKKAIKLGIELHSTPDPWKKWMIEYLKENINQKPIGEIEKMLGLSYRRILTKCNELGIEYVKEGWTEEEVETLKEYAQKCHYTELVKVLPNRSVGAIAAKAYELGIETISEYAKLSEEKIEYIKKNWGVIPATEIARNLKITTSVLYRYKKELNLPNIGQRKKWTPEVIQKLKKDAKTKTRQELAKKYKTSVQQISAIARKNDITLIDSKIVWTDDLNKTLLELVKQDLSLKEISKTMGIRVASIRQNLKKLGISKYCDSKTRARRWTQKEMNLLRELSIDKNASEIASLINKTEQQVMAKARKLGIKINTSSNHTWTEEENRLLIELSKKYVMHIIAKVMDRSEQTIREKAKELNIKIHFKDRCYWTVEEEQQLLKYAKEYTIKEIAYLMDRTVASVTGKLKYMGISAQKSPKFWIEEEVEQLITLSQNFTIQEIANQMNKSYESIIAKMYQMGLKAVNDSNRPWTEEEQNELLELLTSYSTFEVAELLNRSEEAVMVRAIKLGYDIDSKHRKWTENDKLLLQELWGYHSIEYISKKLNRTVSAIHNKAYEFGLGSQISANYDGLKIQEIADIFLVDRNTILTSWVALGLEIDFQKRSNHSVYSYVQIEKLFEFLGENQNIWDSRLLEKNILGKEPEWLSEKRKRDRNIPPEEFRLESLTKQQLILAKSYFLEEQELEDQEQLKERHQKTKKFNKSTNNEK